MYSPWLARPRVPSWHQSEAWQSLKGWNCVWASWRRWCDTWVSPSPSRSETGSPPHSAYLGGRREGSGVDKRQRSVRRMWPWPRIKDVWSGLGYLEKWWKCILTPGSLSDSSLTNGTAPYSASSWTEGENTDTWSEWLDNMQTRQIRKLDIHQEHMEIMFSSESYTHFLHWYVTKYTESCGRK